MFDFDIGQVGFIENVRRSRIVSLSMTEFLLDISGPFNALPVVFFFFGNCRKRAQTEQISFRAKAANNAFGDCGYIGVMPESLTRMNVRKMHFHDRYLGRADCIMNSNRSVAVSGWIDEDIGVFVASLLNPVTRSPS